MTASLLLLVLAVGYALGRVRPLWRIERAAWWRGVSAIRKPSRHPAAWAVLWLLLHPNLGLASYRAWRRTSRKSDSAAGGAS